MWIADGKKSISPHLSLRSELMLGTENKGEGAAELFQREVSESGSVMVLASRSISSFLSP